MSCGVSGRDAGDSFIGWPSTTAYSRPAKPPRSTDQSRPKIPAARMPARLLPALSGRYRLALVAPFQGTSSAVAPCF
jgi:hypothetical protein